ncbi:hypothetical protein [Schleiferilactobacillus shenzhenensis]|uniref:hypothetical protein n=1 Tax=Schleiferilactobacillus shenzhenensis TaxID=1231337 RepID=UPI0012DFB00F|nr:hypothetical protein [Schleiferilactobacillus shenzhenensis]
MTITDQEIKANLAKGASSLAMEDVRLGMTVVPANSLILRDGTVISFGPIADQNCSLITILPIMLGAAASSSDVQSLDMAEVVLVDGVNATFTVFNDSPTMAQRHAMTTLVETMGFREAIISAEAIKKNINESNDPALDGIWWDDNDIERAAFILIDGAIVSGGYDFWLNHSGLTVLRTMFDDSDSDFDTLCWAGNLVVVIPEDMDYRMYGPPTALQRYQIAYLDAWGYYGEKKHA